MRARPPLLACFFEFAFALLPDDDVAPGFVDRGTRARGLNDADCCDRDAAFFAGLSDLDSGFLDSGFLDSGFLDSDFFESVPVGAAAFFDDEEREEDGGVGFDAAF